MTSGRRTRPQVTVVTTTYNWPSVLREAMATVLAQTFTDFEYLVIGDHCTDETEAVVAEFDDPRISWHNLAANTGNQSGVNKIALEMAEGEHIAYLNHDDLWFPDHLATLIEPLTTHDLDLVSGLALSIAPPGSDHRQLIGQPQKRDDGTLWATSMTSSIVHTKAAAEAAGGWIDWRETHEIPTLDFFRRVRSVRGAHAVVSHVTSLKFHSGSRKDSYREKTATEQIRFARLMREDPDLRYREAMKAYAFGSMGVGPPRIPLPTKPKDAPKGWRIEQWRRNRGLDPMLAAAPEGPADAELQEEPSSVRIDGAGRGIVFNDPGAYAEPDA